ncbi:uncharacterized protein LOC62_02G001863 [Vanrija pseudolonga]|uniref:Uncharacterized protein n=1 Tax=Vanrija pseudolonga TaxID=143232 RepID=A0AAF0Y602_9TREE|nr:hypothetical protein LOC62_02G001863 [Vanrija pseudolonga]
MAAQVSQTLAPIGTGTQITVAGSHSVERTPELADVTIRVAADGTDKAKVLKVFKASANDVAGMISRIAPAKQSGGGAAVHAEWPVCDASKPVVRWHTGRLATWWWGPEATRYRAEQDYTVTVHDFSALEVFVSTVAMEKNVDFSNITWRVSLPTRDALEAEVYGGAVLDAKRRALILLAPIMDAPSLTPLEIVEKAADINVSLPRRMGRSGGSIGEDPLIRFEPAPIRHTVKVDTKWAVVN